MPTNDMAGYTGGANVILVSGKKQVRKLVALLHLTVQDTRNVRNVNCVGLRHRIKHNLMYFLWMEI
jgi:hypothetical protein